MCGKNSNADIWWGPGKIMSWFPAALVCVNSAGGTGGADQQVSRGWRLVLITLHVPAL